MEIILKVNLKTIKDMEKDSLNILIEIILLVNLKMMKEMEKEL
jgi:hypothetical protein